MAIKESIHEPLIHLARYAKDTKTVFRSMSIISGLCSAKKLQVRRFMDLKVLEVIKQQLLNQLVV